VYIGFEKRGKCRWTRQATLHAPMSTQMQTDEKKFGRFPDVEHRYGLKRSKCYELNSAGLIKSAVIKKKGARSGVRLIDFESVENFLRANTV
jgi:hypothetical protein